MGYTCRFKLAKAFHEAGHACMALILGRPLDQVSMLFAWQLASPERIRRTHPSRRHFEEIETQVMIGLAGPLAEDLANAVPGSITESGQFRADRRVACEVHDLAVALATNADERASIVNELCRRTRNAMAHRGFAEAVAAVAWALVYRLQLSAAEVERIFWNTAINCQIGSSPSGAESTTSRADERVKSTA